MHRVAVASRVFVLLAVAWAAAGCTSLVERSRSPLHFVGLYLQDRAQDLMEVADVGVTVSPEPCFALYGALASLTPAGVAYVDGRFFGLGGGQLFGLGSGTWGSTPFYLAAAGMLVWGYEELGWQTFDLTDMSTVHCQDVGPSGLFLAPQGRPGPVPS